MNTLAPPSPRHLTAFETALGRFVSKMSFLAPDVIVSSGWLEHGPFAFWLAETLKPRTFVELGTYSGYSYFAFCQAIRKLDLPTKCYAVDTWRGDEHASFYGDSVYRAVCDLNQKYEAFSTLIRANFDDAVRYFPDGSIDLLHIDGRHFYDDVKADFETWHPKLAENAIVLFHDTNVRERDFGVWRFFHELRQNHATFEFTHGNGLGVLALGIIPESLQGLFACRGEEADAVSSIYAQLGANLAHRWATKEALERLSIAHDAAREKESELRQEFADLRQNYSDLCASLDTTERALLFVAAEGHSGRVRTRSRSSLADRIGNVLGLFRRTVNAKTQTEDDAVISKIRATGLFQDGYYLATNPQLVNAGTDPVLHFVRHGCRGGRRPNPFFDPLYYVSRYLNGSFEGENPLLFYADRGWKEGHRPSVEFDPTFYLTRYPDVAASGQEPLRHYIESGRREGRLADQKVE